jgi:hypothetical protein
MRSAAFASVFGSPRSLTGVSAADLGLAQSRVIREWTEGGARGVYRSGLLSLCSARENSGDLGPWARWLPQGGRLFASSAFGFLFVTTGDDLWVVNPQAGEVVESDVPLGELPDLLCEANVLEDFLRQELFEVWHELGGETLDRHWLCPTRGPMPLGFDWTVSSLEPMSPAVFLSFTAQLFADDGPDGVEVRRLEP